MSDHFLVKWSSAWSSRRPADGAFAGGPLPQFLAQHFVDRGQEDGFAENIFHLGFRPGLVESFVEHQDRWQATSIKLLDQGVVAWPGFGVDARVSGSVLADRPHAVEVLTVD
jgi:hypothetical protein